MTAVLWRLGGSFHSSQPNELRLGSPAVGFSSTQARFRTTARLCSGAR